MNNHSDSLKKLKLIRGINSDSSDKKLLNKSTSNSDLSSVNGAYNSVMFPNFENEWFAEEFPHLASRGSINSDQIDVQILQKEVNFPFIR